MAHFCSPYHVTECLILLGYICWRDREDTRDRESEFSERTEIPKDELFRRLQNVVDESYETLESVEHGQWLTNRLIQGHDVSKLHAMMHSVTHFQGHVQEIISITRQQLGNRYRFEWSPE